MSGDEAFSIMHGTVVDGTGREPLPDARVDVVDGRIAWVGRMADRPDDDPGAPRRRIDATGRTVIPGLADCHVHLCHTLAKASEWGPPAGRWLSESEQIVNGVMQTQRALRAGLTTVRDLGCATTGVFAIAQLTETGAVAGPRVLPAGRIICMTGGHGHRTGRECDGPVEARKAAREQIKAGARWLKVAATGGARSPNEKLTSIQLDEEEMHAVVAEAGGADMAVAAHAHASAGIGAAVRAGVRTIEHGVFLTDEVVDQMVAAGVALVPTLSVYHRLVERGIAEGAEPYACAKSEEALEPHLDSVRRAVRGGVRVVFGTDAGGPYHQVGADNVLELELMREAGMSPMQVLRAATGEAAAVLGVGDETGTVEVGKAADLVALDGDPLLDVSAYGTVAFVVKGGRLNHVAEPMP